MSYRLFGLILCLYYWCLVSYRNPIRVCTLQVDYYVLMVLSVPFNKCVCVCRYVCTHTQIHTYIHIFIHMCMHAYIYINIFIIHETVMYCNPPIHNFTGHRKNFTDPKQTNTLTYYVFIQRQ